MASESLHDDAKAIQEAAVTPEPPLKQVGCRQKQVLNVHQLMPHQIILISIFLNHGLSLFLLNVLHNDSLTICLASSSVFEINSG